MVGARRRGALGAGRIDRAGHAEPHPPGTRALEDPSLNSTSYRSGGCSRRLPLHIAVALLAWGLVPAAASAFSLRAFDTPNDEGHSVTLAWRKPDPSPPDWTVERRPRGGSAFTSIATVSGQSESYADTSAQNGVAYQYRLVAADDPAVASDVSPPAAAALNWFDTGKTNVFCLVLLFGLTVFAYIFRARRGVRMTFRKIAGLTAIEEAIGRATEMGKGVLYVPGIQDIDDIQTIASMIILGNVFVPTNSPAVFTVAEEVVRSGYSDAGRIDAYRSEQVRYLTSEQFAYVAAVNGIMLRERPAANLFLGAFFAESLILAETGHSTGAIQIAGTANVHQLPFFVVACDFTLIGEEYYAASAYLSNDPRLLGSLKASDMVKIVIIGIILVGVVLEGMGIHGFRAFFETR
jgi:hypothetical protein